jgi:hypothetical protein
MEELVEEFLKEKVVFKNNPYSELDIKETT